MKRIISLLKKRRSGGFTLVEMIVSCALLAVLMAGMMLFISPIISSFNDNQTDITAQNTTICVQEYITRKIRNSYKTFIVENTNYTDIQANSAYTAKIKEMNDFCSSVNGTAIEKSKTYLLECLSLKYDSTQKKYFLYKEKVNMNNNGKLVTSDAQKVFADCLYDGLYSTYEFSLAPNGDYVEGGSEPLLRKDALKVEFNTYRDDEYKNLVYNGTGLTEMRQVKVMLASGGKDTEYYVKVEPPSPLGFSDMTEGSRDIYIYYVTRQLGVKTTP